MWRKSKVCVARSTLIVSASTRAARVGKEYFTGGLRVPLYPVFAMVRQLHARHSLRILLQAWSGKTKLPDCMPRVALCHAEEQEGFGS